MPNAERCPASKRQGMTGSFSDSLVEGPGRVASGYGWRETNGNNRKTIENI